MAVKPDPTPVKKKRVGTTAPQKALGATLQRVLTLKQLKDVIADIYSQKIKFDKKCETLKQPRETMEQYMYTYLNQKYGLKNIIVEWAAAIINGLKTFLREDHDVTLFAKILKNECDEEFRFIQTHVKETLQSLLRSLLKEKHSFKSETDINRMQEQVLSGTVDEWIWRKIIEKMYDPRDFQILEARFQALIDDKRQRNSAFDGGRPSLGGGPAKPKLPEKLTYSEFQKTILDFQLSEHEKFLSEFTQLFKEVDRDRNGIIEELEFRALLREMRADPAETELLVQMLDPYNN